MSKTYNLTEEQLDFISYMKEGIASHPELNERFHSCMANYEVKVENRPKTAQTLITKHHSPKKMIQFLALFSRDDRFKWYTHKWDMSTPFDIDEMIKRQTVDKSVLSDMAYPKESGPAVNEKTYNQVWNFINFSKPESYSWKNTKFKSIRCGWHSIVGLSKANPEIPVENLILSDGHQFKDYVRMFKSAIEFRTDLSDDDRFSELVWSNITPGLPKDFDLTFDPKFDEIGYDLNVYCDVVGLLSALNIVCNWLVKFKARSSEVRVDLISENEYYILEIFHAGSYFNNIEKLKNPSGDLDVLRTRLFSVCDFSLEGDYMKDGKMNGALIVNALDNNTKMTDKSLTPCDVNASDKALGGVKYKFKIYKR